MLNYFGKNAIFFMGVVENRQDPLQIGRVQVRVFGKHTEKKNCVGEHLFCIATEDLPWAKTVLPTTSAAMAGIGASATGLVEGSWVVGMSLDGESMTELLVLGSIGGIYEQQSEVKGKVEDVAKYENPLRIASQGFYDPRTDGELAGAPRPPADIQYNHDGSGTSINEASSAEAYPPENGNFETRQKGMAGEPFTSRLARTPDGLPIGQPHPAPCQNPQTYQQTNSIVGKKKMSVVKDIPIANVKDPINYTISYGNEDGSVIREKKGIITNPNATIPPAEDRDLSLENLPLPCEWKFQERFTKHAPQYPYNKVIEFESGHAIEVDDTPGRERMSVWHRSGTFVEIHPDGTMVSKKAADDQEIVLKDKDLLVRGNYNLTVNRGCRIFVNAENKKDNDFIVQVGENSNLIFKADSNATIQFLATDGEINFLAKKINMKATDRINIEADKASISSTTSTTCRSDAITLVHGKQELRLFSENRVYGWSQKAINFMSEGQFAIEARNALTMLARTFISLFSPGQVQVGADQALIMSSQGTASCTAGGYNSVVGSTVGLNSNDGQFVPPLVEQMKPANTSELKIGKFIEDPDCEPADKTSCSANSTLGKPPSSGKD